mmetsp:Transcript_6184/g.18532  ORF Transcript_6184/g.18532 Transcript_6184/m.18532 type:complete len:259 (-) Transcript_6184:492-1268(-)
MADYLLEGGVLVTVIDPHLRQRQAQLLVGVSQLPVVGLEQRDGTGLDPVEEDSAVVSPRTVVLEREVLLARPHLDLPLLAKARSEDKLPTHQACNLLEEQVLGVGVGRKAAVARRVLGLERRHVIWSLHHLDRRSQVLEHVVQQLSVAPLGLDGNRVLALLGVDPVVTGELALCPKLATQLPLLASVNDREGDLLPRLVLLALDFGALCCLGKGVILALALGTPRVPHVHNNRTVLAESLVQVLLSEGHELGVVLHVR